MLYDARYYRRSEQWYSALGANLIAKGFLSPQGFSTLYAECRNLGLRFESVIVNATLLTEAELQAVMEEAKRELGTLYMSEEERATGRDFKRFKAVVELEFIAQDEASAIEFVEGCVHPPAIKEADVTDAEFSGTLRDIKKLERPVIREGTEAERVEGVFYFKAVVELMLVAEDADFARCLATECVNPDVKDVAQFTKEYGLRSTITSIEEDEEADA